jgi:predicted patatin/cPLA2 family phospholipase
VVPVLVKEFQSKRKNYNHYTQKIKGLEREKQIFEDSGKGSYSKKDLEKLLRV